MAARRVPKLCYHRGVGRYYVTLDRKEHYLGGAVPYSETPPDEVRAAYDAAVGAWLLARGRSPAPAEVGPEPTVGELWLAYLRHADVEYRKHGRHTSEYTCVKSACRIVAREYGRLACTRFGEAELEEVRRKMISLGWERRYLNQQVSRVRRMFRWGARRKLYPASVWLDLKALPDVPRSKGLPEARPVPHVPDDVVEATIPHLPASLQPLVRVHRLVGCRADEACVMRPGDFDRRADPDGGCWLYTPSTSKSAERYWVGPRAQAILLPLLEGRPPDAWLFPTRRRGRGCWSTASYRRAVDRACRRHQIPHWSPLQVRHAAAEEARREHPRGIEATQARLRHREITVSQVYAHDLDRLGKDVARRLG